MKQLFTIAVFFAATYTSYSQSLNYQDLAILFSQDDQNGSARFTAMSGAFGAIGGDISAVNINPAGLAVYKNSAFSGTLNSRNSDITSTYYGNSEASQDQFFNLSHAGAVLVFESAYKSDWSKFALGFNYRITKDFNDHFLSKGNSGIATFTEYPLDNNDPKNEYNLADGQDYDTAFAGEISELNIIFSSVYQKKLYAGLSFNTYDLSFSQRSLLTELNSDVNGNELDVDLYQENYTKGTGFSFSTGFIYKLNPSFRFGLSYQTPTWFTEILQDTNYDQDSDINIGEAVFYQGGESYNEFNSRQVIAYQLKTSSKVIASAAYIFGKNGLISIDYTSKNYQKTKLSDGVFTNENQFFQNDLKNTYAINIGTEWRVDQFSIRGGYRFEQSPDKYALDSDDLKGYSFGGGYNFGNMKIDLSYSVNNRTAISNFYPQFNDVNPAELKLDNKTVTATFSFNL